MDCNNSDLGVIESSLPAIVQDQELGKTAALVLNLCQNVSDPQ